jgi:hypothetical protein
MTESEQTEGGKQAQQQAQKRETPPSNGGGRLYDLQRRNGAERATGLEPATSSLGSWHSTN